MNASLLPRRGLARNGAIALLLLFAAAAAVAADLTETYADKGTRIPDERHSSPQEASLRALLQLELDPTAGRIRHLGTDRVQLIDTGSRLRIFHYDQAGELQESHEYSGAGYQRGQGTTFLRLRSASGRDDAVVLALTVAEEGLLQVDVYRVSPGVFGRSSERVGRYLFHRGP